MGTEKGVSEQHSSREMQGLVCTEVLRDWLKHLEHDADDGRRTSFDGPNAEDDAAHR
ncbi:MAG TPA: hypothetical protein VKO38_01150 [Wenzhouxiangella sp.]|nr:hypothetical protein [Wenzhouxiangella sp.]